MINAQREKRRGERGGGGGRGRALIMEDVLFPLHTFSPVPKRSEGDIIRIMLGKNIGGGKRCDDID